MRRSGRSSRREPELFDRVLAALAAGAEATPRLAADAAELAERARRFEARAGVKGLVELSPYMASLLRLTEKARAIRPTRVRRAAGF